MQLQHKIQFIYMIPNNLVPFALFQACISPLLQISHGKEKGCFFYFQLELTLIRSYDGSLLMFSSADGYCSVAVFSNNELGIKYEKPIEAIQEYDIEMMDIPVNAEVQQPTQQIKTTVATWTTSKPQKRRVSLIQVIPASQSATTPVNNATSNPKKRRITPILVSSSGSSTPMQPPPP